MQNKRHDYILYYVALFLPFLHFLYVFPVSAVPILFIGFSIICTTLYIYLKKKELSRKYFLIAVFLIFVFFLVKYKLLLNSLFSIYNSITEVYANSSFYTFDQLSISDTTYLQVGIFLVLSSLFVIQMMILYHCILEKVNLFTVFLCTFLFFFPSLLYTPPMPWPLTIGLFVLWSYLLFISFYKKRAKMFNGIAQSHIFVYVVTIVLAVCIGLFTFLPPQSYQLSTINTNLRMNLLDRMYQLSYNFRFGSEKEGEVDLNLAGNRHYTGEEQFTVEREKSDTLYLKTLSTSSYKDNAWSVLPESVYDKSKYISWNQIRTWENAYTTLKEDKKETIKIQDKRKDKQYALEPYNIFGIHQETGIYYDAYMTSLEKDNRTYSYSLWDTDSGIYTENTEANAYINFVKKYYLEIPENIKELFSNELYLEYFTNDEEAIAYVKSYLNKNYSYTLNPGYPPTNKDFITWFLKESHRGYCVHFASAAVMMFRYYGIPSRYVEGYRVDDFTQEHKGIARDHDAHAWVEIFTPDKGWTPVEVTPGFKGTDTNEESLDHEDEQKDTQNNTPKEEPKENEEKNKQEEQNKNLQKPINDNRTQQQVRKSNFEIKISQNMRYAIYGIIFIGIVYGQRKLRYYLKRKKMHHQQQREAIFAYMKYYEMLCTYGANENAEILALFEKGVYSKEGLHAEELQQFISLIEKEKKDLLHKLKFRKKWKLRYKDALD